MWGWFRGSSGWQGRIQARGRLRVGGCGKEEREKSFGNECQDGVTNLGGR